MNGQYAEVALPPPVSRELIYRWPEGVEIRTGALVLVPVARRLLTGVVVGPAALPIPSVPLRPEQIRGIEQVLDDQALPAEVVELCRWMADYYFAPLGSALMAALPPGLQQISGRQVRLAENARLPAGALPLEARVFAELQARGPLTVTALRRRLGAKDLERSLRRLKTAGCIEVALSLPRRRIRPRQEVRLRLADPAAVRSALSELEIKAPRQAACLRYLLEQAEPPSRQELIRQGFKPAVIEALRARGLLERLVDSVVRNPLAHLEREEAEILTPTSDQQQVLQSLEAALEARRFYPALLQGVTGSGKTLVYLHLVARALQQGRTAIVLVPEIALAWQMVRRFKTHFGDQVAVLHSHLSPGERYDTWLQVRRGEQRVVIGARSAILAPVRDLGVIVVDEEHDAAYKQEDLDSHHRLTYNARDLALVRGQRQAAVVVLGSATPSLESYWNAKIGKYHLHLLPRRVDDRPLPRVEVVDMRQEPFQRRQPAVFSRALRLKMRERLARGEQIVLLQNRRGFAPFLLCLSCGEGVQCQRCRVSLTYHREPHPELRCHYCDFRSPLPQHCPSCGSVELHFEGTGTQKVEKLLEQQFPGVRVIRMDLDTTGWKGAHDQLVERFRRREADVLLGTQMVAKGLDFPEVTLVGVISADTGMHLPDFRAAERTFQLLTQVAGRSGRGQIPGEVIIQTRLPANAVLRAAAAQDFAAFAEAELAERRQAGFPPFGRLIVFGWRGLDEAAVEESAQKGVASLRPSPDDDWEILGPSPAPLGRLRGYYRWQALLRGPSAQRLHLLTAQVLPAMRAACVGGVSLTINVDPLTMR